MVLDSNNGEIISEAEAGRRLDPELSHINVTLIFQSYGIDPVLRQIKDDGVKVVENIRNPEKKAKAIETINAAPKENYIPAGIMWLWNYLIGRGEAKQAVNRKRGRDASDDTSIKEPVEKKQCRVSSNLEKLD